ncbi:MAG: outer membrane homotrimeric porin, partial [Desulfovibrionaceae bacterium]
RMGIQPIAMPAFAFSNMVFETDVAAVAASYTFNDTVALTATWMRPYNDNWSGTSSPTGYMDNFDLFSLVLPMRFEGVKVTPWAMAGAYGPNVARRADNNDFFNPQKPHDVSPVNINMSGQPGDGLFWQEGMLPAAFSSSKDRSSVFSHQYTSVGWGGASFDVTTLSPWRFAGDFVYGTVNSDRDYLKRSGWYGTLLAEFKGDWGTPGLYGWYYSGDDSDPHNGSERMPTVSTANNYFNCLSSFGYRGTAGIGGGKGILGGAPDGVWGVGARVADLSFVENLSHVFRVHYLGGTNNTKMASYITGRKTTDNAGRPIYRNNTDFNSPVGVYMTTADTGLELNFDSKYKIYDNFNVVFELGYIHLWMDDSVWGRYQNIAGNSLSYKDAWKANLVLTYAF